MFNKIKEKMNMNMKPNKTNKTNKIMILLSLFLILLNESNNIVYAIDYVEKVNGQLKIIPEKITYKYDGIEETEIKSWDDESIKLSEEIIKSISRNDKTEVTLNYSNFLSGQYLEINKDTTLDKGLLFTGNSAYISIKRYGKLTVGNNINYKNSLFGIIGVNFNNDTNNTYLFGNQKKITINTENTLILGNIILGNRFISKNEGEKGIALFYNNENSSLTINSKNIYVSGNILNSTERYARLFYNTGILTLGSDKTDTITIENNEIKGECNNSLLYNYGIFNINASNISIKNNEISGCYFIYNAVYNAGTMNINLYGNNPTFEISGNKAGEENKKLTADIFLDKDSKLNFVNHSNNEATIILENGIKGKGSVIFKNEDSKNGSFKLELGSAGIEANEMNIESNVTLLLSINSEGLIGGLEGYDDDSELNITDGKKLTIGINKKNVKNIGMGHSYTVVSNFRNL